MKSEKLIKLKDLMDRSCKVDLDESVWVFLRQYYSAIFFNDLEGIAFFYNGNRMFYRLDIASTEGFEVEVMKFEEIFDILISDTKFIDIIEESVSCSWGDDWDMFLSDKEARFIKDRIHYDMSLSEKEDLRNLKKKLER